MNLAQTIARFRARQRREHGLGLGRRLPEIFRAAMSRRRGLAADADVSGERPSSDDDGGALDVSIVFSDVAWRLTLAWPGGTARIETRVGAIHDGLDETGDVDADWAAGLRAALKSLAPGERADIRSVALYPFAPGIEVFDNRSVRAFGADDGGLRRIAEDLAGSGECAFARMAVGESSDDRHLIAVTDMDVIRRSLSILGELAPKLIRVAPASAAWLAEVSRDDARARAMLHLGRNSSVLVAIDATSKVIVVRSAPVGLATFAHLIADVNSLPIAEAVKEMAARDMIGRAAAAGMDAPLAELATLIRDTSTYISDSRLAEPPGVVELIGGQEAAYGLASLLQDWLQMDVQVVAGEATPPVEPIEMNLLSAVEGPLFAEGAREYSFVDGKFVAAELDGRRPKVAKADAGPRRFAGMELPAFAGAATPRRLAAMGVALAAAAAFLIYDVALAPAARAHAAAAANLADSLARSAALNEKVRDLRSTARRDALLAGGQNKILWAEKFVSIADALPAGLWLAHASIAKSDRRVGQVDVVATRLVLRGVARSVGQTRLQDIASFIETLERDEAFMQDFRAISFAGLGAADASGGGIGATFEIHAWYDENKRRTGAAAADLGGDPLGAARAAAASRRSFGAGGGALFGGGGQ